MDIARPDVAQKKKVRHFAYAALAIAVIPLIAYSVSHLKVAAPTVDRSTILTDTVKRGTMLRDVQGLGTLVPETVLLIPAATDGRVEQRFILPGTPVKANTPILKLTNPELEQAEVDAEFQLKGAQAQYNSLRAQLDNQLLDLRTKAAAVGSDFQQAKLNADRESQLFQQGLGAEIDFKLSQVKASELGKQNDIAQSEVDTFAKSIDAQLSVQQAKVAEQKALYELKKSQIEHLEVRPGMDGVLQELNVEVGQNVTQGTVLARVAQPSHLKAQLRVAETQAKDIQIGQKASVDTHNGIVPGHVSRVDPAVQNGTVTVDVVLDGPLPQGARPDLSVEGTIELERLVNVLYLGRPVHADPDSTVGLFKVMNSSDAVRVRVTLGPASVNAVEVRDGLQVGDEVILSDMSAWDNFDRVQLK